MHLRTLKLPVKALCLICLLISLITGSAHAQEAESELKVRNDKLQQIVKELITENESLTSKTDELDGALYKKYIEAKMSEYDYQIGLMGNSRADFLHQRIASYFILVLVIAVVFSGLYFSHIQLMAGLGKNANSPGAGRPLAAPDMNTKIVVESNRLNIESSVVGIIILMISIAFLYIYILKVYRIEYVDPYAPSLTSPVEATSEEAPPDKVP